MYPVDISTLESVKKQVAAAYDAASSFAIFSLLTWDCDMKLLVITRMYA